MTIPARVSNVTLQSKSVAVVRVYSESGGSEVSITIPADQVWDWVPGTKCVITVERVKE
jgi:hypothetical protein